MNSLVKVFMLATKRQNLLRLLLLIPYFAWGIGLALLLLFDRFAPDTADSNAVFNVLIGIVSIYTIGILLWGIPYTLLAIGLWVWSIKKPAAAVYKVFAFSPLLLAVLMLVEVGLVFFWPQETMLPTSSTDFLSYILVTALPALLFGYGFVAGGAVLYRALTKIRLTAIEGEAE